MSDKDLVERPEDGPEDDREQTLVAHLIELRSRIVRMAVSVLLVFACLSPFMKQIFDYLSKPLMVALPQGAKLLATGVIAPFMVPLKVTLFVAFVIALPYVLWQLWGFIAPDFIGKRRNWPLRSLFRAWSCSSLEWHIAISSCSVWCFSSLPDSLRTP